MRLETTEEVQKYIDDQFPRLQEELKKELYEMNMSHRWVLGDARQFEIRIVDEKAKNILYSKEIDRPAEAKEFVFAFLEGFRKGFDEAKNQAIALIDNSFSSVKIEGR